MHSMLDLVCGLSMLPLVAVSATGMPAPHFYSSSFASSLWNATQSLRHDQHSYRLREPRPQTEEHGSDFPASSPAPSDTTEATTTATTSYARSACPADELSCSESLGTWREPSYNKSPQSSFAVSGAEECPPYTKSSVSLQEHDDSKALLADYLSRLEQRLTHIEEQNQQLLSSSSLKAKSFKLKLLWSATSEGLRLLIVTAFPVIVCGTLLGLLMVVMMNVLVFLFELAHPFIEKVLHKTGIGAMIVSRFVVELFIEDRKRTGSSSPGSESMEPKFRS